VVSCTAQLELARQADPVEFWAYWLLNRDERITLLKSIISWLCIGGLSYATNVAGDDCHQHCSMEKPANTSRTRGDSYRANTKQLRLIKAGDWFNEQQETHHVTQHASVHAVWWLDYQTLGRRTNTRLGACPDQHS
jgi:hypothetical protein